MKRVKIKVYTFLILFIVFGAFLFGNLSLAETVDLPKTGQTTCYDDNGYIIPCAGTGQDGDIQAGIAWPEPRFIDNGDGTVTDSLTGLMWLKDAGCLGKVIWQEAFNVVASLNTNPGNYACGGYTATYNDWVLPSINELESLVNVEKRDSSAWLNSQGFMNVTPYYYQSSTTLAYSLNNRWLVWMGDGSVDRKHYSYEYYVLPVRATTSPPAQIWKTGQTTIYAANDDGDIQRGVEWPAPRFTDNADGTVTDNLTGLMWLKDAGCFEKMTWQGALDMVVDFNTNSANYQCAGYTTTEYNDWRLPNRKELHSLTDYSQCDPALPTEHIFLNVISDPSIRVSYWSATTFANNTSHAWVVYMFDGLVYYDYNDNNLHHIWPVRTAESTVPVEKQVFIDIMPGTCPNSLNIKSKGTMSVAVLGTDDLNVTQIDPTSILLQGVVPLSTDFGDAATPFDCEQVGPDGIVDLVLEFKIQEIVHGLGVINDGDVLGLVLTGKLNDGTPIKGEDTVVILKKGKKR